MYYFSELIDYIIGLWAAIIIFITAPIWFVPYIIYRTIKYGKE